ncbi:hypothetical protein Pmani_039572 [Petrolisthes manimaculis]|uniref:Uncharacterized protein n=1 Tax=Petrolisthes manimaculis TaxID=1843537 RepID=A0AAE1TJD2_9EUCA|nr:hypothetical protein Pmani_039572 [Petrolisthes manimaculis]
MAITTNNNTTFLLLLMLSSLSVTTLGYQLNCYACTGYNPGFVENQLFNNKHCPTDNFDPEYVATEITSPEDYTPQCFSITVHGEFTLTRRYAVPRIFTVSILQEYLTNATTNSSDASLLLSLLQQNLNPSNTTSHALPINPSLLPSLHQQDINAPRSNIRLDGYLCDTDLCNASPRATTTFCSPSFGLLLLLGVYILT